MTDRDTPAPAAADGMDGDRYSLPQDSDLGRRYYYLEATDVGPAGGASCA